VTRSKTGYLISCPLPQPEADMPCEVKEKAGSNGVEGGCVGARYGVHVTPREREHTEKYWAHYNLLKDFCETQSVGGYDHPFLWEVLETSLQTIARQYHCIYP
jgi:hypothetical protein